jgi:hypothetical protein
VALHFCALEHYGGLIRALNIHTCRGSHDAIGDDRVLTSDGLGFRGVVEKEHAFAPVVQIASCRNRPTNSSVSSFCCAFTPRSPRAVQRRAVGRDLTDRFRARQLFVLHLDARARG